VECKLLAGLGHLYAICSSNKTVGMKKSAQRDANTARWL